MILARCQFLAKALTDRSSSCFLSFLMAMRIKRDNTNESESEWRMMNPTRIRLCSGVHICFARCVGGMRRERP